MFPASLYPPPPYPAALFPGTGHAPGSGGLPAGAVGVFPGPAFPASAFPASLYPGIKAPGGAVDPGPSAGFLFPDPDETIARIL